MASIPIKQFVGAGLSKDIHHHAGLRLRLDVIRPVGEAMLGLMAPRTGRSTRQPGNKKLIAAFGKQGVQAVAPVFAAGYDAALLIDTRCARHYRQPKNATRCAAR